MAYFSNGTEGEMYKEQWCERCIHDGHGENACPVWTMHLTYNYDQFENPDVKAILHQLIPRNGIHNEQCSMFVEEK